MRIADIEPGALFSANGIYAVKTEYHYPDGNSECILLASGEYAHFPEGDQTSVVQIQAPRILLDQLHQTNAALVVAREENKQLKEALVALAGCPIVAGSAAGIRDSAKRMGVPNPMQLAADALKSVSLPNKDKHEPAPKEETQEGV